MCQRNRLVLTECRRSDVFLFDFSCSLIPEGSRGERDLSEVVAEAREKFRFDGPADHNLVKGHRKRVALNTELNELHRPGVAIRVEPKHKKPGVLTQPMWLWPGIRLLGAATEGDKVRNQLKYDVESINDGTIRFTCGLSIPAEKVADLFLLSYAQTYASCPGTEFDGTLRLHDTTHRFFHSAPPLCWPLQR
jgi:hypothetical protein